MRISVDDGCASDVRLAELCERFNIKLIIYLPAEWKTYAKLKGFTPLSVKQAQELAYKHEIGSHTITHPLLTGIRTSEAEYEIQMSKILLQSRFGRPVLKFAPPRGYINNYLLNYAKQFYNEIRLTRGENLVHIHPDSGANNNRDWRDCINDNTKELWCHSWELDKFNLWKELEEFLESTYS